jgi:hypothetical protein
MVRGLRMLVATLVVAGLTAGVAAAGAGGSQKFDLLGPNGNAFCDGSGVISGAPGFGFAVINAPSNGTVEATVSLKGVKPNTTYGVGLIQGLADCGTIDGTITTNGQGNGNAHVSEPSVSSHAFVGLVEDPCLCTFYTTQTYNH